MKNSEQASLHNTEVDHHFLTSEGEMVLLLLKGESLYIEKVLTSGLVFALFCSPPNSSSSYKQKSSSYEFIKDVLLNVQGGLLHISITQLVR